MMGKERFADIFNSEDIAPLAGFAARPAARAAAVLPPDRKECGIPESSYAANGTDIRRLQKINKETPEQSIDLHGLNVLQAHAALDDFLAVALRQGRRHVEIVHGYGSHSAEGKGVLRDKTRQWLKKCDKVLGYIEARNNPGASLVLLRRGDK